MAKKKKSPEPQKVEPKMAKPKMASPGAAAIQKHPKFSKFKKGNE